MCPPSKAGGPSDRFPVGTNVTVRNSCPEGLEPREPVTLWTCTNDGTWQRHPASLSCISLRRCTRPPSVPHGKVIWGPTSFVQGSVVAYGCNRRYQQVGGSELRRCYNGTWLGDDLVCSNVAGQKTRKSL